MRPSLGERTATALAEITCAWPVTLPFAAKEISDQTNRQMHVLERPFLPVNEFECVIGVRCRDERLFASKRTSAVTYVVTTSLHFLVSSYGLADICTTRQ